MNKLNLRRTKPFTDCNTLLAETFFQIIETNNLKLLSATNKNPLFDKYFFVEIFDNIMNEYEELSGNNGYTSNLDKVNHDLIKQNKLSGLAAGYYLLRYDEKKGIEALEYWGCYVKDNKKDSLDVVISMIKQLKTNIKIDRLRDNDEEKKSVGFDDMLVNIENSLNKNEIDKNKLTLSKWCAYIKSIEKKNIEYEKLKNNGRNY